MNAKISVTCYKSKTLRNGESPLMVKITKDGKRSLKTLGISLKPRFWDFEHDKPKSNCPNRTHIVSIITNTLQKYQAIQLDMEAKNKNYTVSEILNDKPTKAKQMTVEDFLTLHIQQLRDNGKVGNSYAYLNLRTTLHNFYGKKLNFLFSAVDVGFCNRFETWMRKNKFEDTTMNYYFRTLRATYNKAVEIKCANREKSPFIEYKLSRFCTKTKKRALTKENVKKILEMDCSTMNEKERLAHDIFSFSYYCGGISLVDIANLTSSNITDGRLRYERQKTHGSINLVILDEAKAIIAYYAAHQKKAGYLFPILDKRIHITPMQKYNRVRKLCRQINKELHSIADRLEIKEDVTTYVARHSFATILKKSGVNIGIISQALGHQDIKTTQIYLSKFDNEQVDQAMLNLL
ncbi:MAG: site-specific integrase [Bacteroidaceae bacterium]|nr:site-specific integrase [Bacteroidaceae bacterium]